MNGVLVVDKPTGPTSHDVVAVARRTWGQRRIGHTGTLDPLASGVLPLACGKATRLVRFMSASDKDYRATIRFGVETDTYDVAGKVVQSSPARPTREAGATPSTCSRPAGAGCTGGGQPRRGARRRGRGAPHLLRRLLRAVVRARPGPAPGFGRLPRSAAANALRAVHAGLGHWSRSAGRREPPERGGPRSPHARLGADGRAPSRPAGRGGRRTRAGAGRAWSAARGRPFPVDRRAANGGRRAPCDDHGDTRDRMDPPRGRRGRAPGCRSTRTCAGLVASGRRSDIR
jgi:hypothetical protein